MLHFPPPRKFFRFPPLNQCIVSLKMFCILTRTYKHPSHLLSVRTNHLCMVVGGIRTNHLCMVVGGIRDWHQSRLGQVTDNRFVLVDLCFICSLFQATSNYIATNNQLHPLW